jgi:hypothetical protein
MIANGTTSDTWTEARVADLTRLWAEGFSASVIGAQLGLSRNSVIGKAHRLKLLPPKERKNVVRKESAKKHVERRDIPKIVAMGIGQRIIKTTEAVEQPKIRCVEIECATPFNDVTGCWYPSDGDGPVLWCNGKRKEGSSFCVPHHDLVWQAPRIPIRRFVGGAAA